MNKIKKRKKKKEKRKEKKERKVIRSYIIYKNDLRGLQIVPFECVLKELCIWFSESHNT